MKANQEREKKTMKKTWTVVTINGKDYYRKTWPVADGTRVTKSYGNEDEPDYVQFAEDLKTVLANGGKLPDKHKNPMLPQLAYYFKKSTVRQPGCNRAFAVCTILDTSAGLSLLTARASRSMLATLQEGDTADEAQSI